jgi:hypothetical protein
MRLPRISNMSSLFEKAWKPERNGREYHDERHGDEIANNERQCGPVNLSHGGVRGGHPFHDEQQKSERWRGEGNLQIEQHENSEPYGMKSESVDNGHENGDGHHHHRNLLHEDSQEEQDDLHADEDHDGRQREIHGKLDHAPTGAGKSQQLTEADL